tara:strand:+ start:781 stop:1200 length:420 start_codon:yes stop_codon:yes gene_type:complete
MECVEINPVGQFDTWEPTKVAELTRNEISDCLGQKLLFENDNILVWEVALVPYERLPFRKIQRDFNLTSLTEGLVIRRFGDGKINLVRLQKGDSAFYEFDGEETVYDLENIGEQPILLNIVEFKPFSISKQSINRESHL